MWVSFGNASGPVENFNLGLLSTKGSLFCTRPTLVHYIAKREDLVATAKDLFDVVSSGVVKIPVNQTYALKDAQRAQRELEGRKTTGASILIP
jgi:NADPH2:quinone reductase